MSKDQAVILAALAFEAWAVQNVGATSDWPADFRTDNEKTSDELSALLTELSGACKAYRETPELVTGAARPDVPFTLADLKKAEAELAGFEKARTESLRRLCGFDVHCDNQLPANGFRLVCGPQLYAALKRKGNEG